MASKPRGGCLEADPHADGEGGRRLVGCAGPSAKARAEAGARRVGPRRRCWQQHGVVRISLCDAAEVIQTEAPLTGEIACFLYVAFRCVSVLNIEIGKRTSVT